MISIKHISTVFTITWICLIQNWQNSWSKSRSFYLLPDGENCILTSIIIEIWWPFIWVPIIVLHLLLQIKLIRNHIYFHLLFSSSTTREWSTKALEIITGPIIYLPGGLSRNCWSSPLFCFFSCSRKNALSVWHCPFIVSPFWEIKKNQPRFAYN